MLLKIAAFIAAAFPLFLFVRSFVSRRPSRLREGVREFKRNVDIAIWIFLGVVGTLAALALGKLIWTWASP